MHVVAICRADRWRIWVQGLGGMAHIHRSFHLKRIVPLVTKSDRFDYPADLSLHTHIAAALDDAGGIWARHYPARQKAAGRRCVFFKKGVTTGTACLFHAYIYHQGDVPDQAKLDDSDATITHDPIVDEEGNPLEIVERVAVLVLGNALIIEAGRTYGQLDMVLRGIRHVIRRTNPRFPGLVPHDAPGLTFARLAALKGGVTSVTATLRADRAPENDTGGSALESIVRSTWGRSDLKQAMSVEAPDDAPLDAGIVEDWLEEASNGVGFSSVVVKFRDGSSSNHELGEYREKHGVDVPAVRAGKPGIPELETVMRDYLRQLCTPHDGYQLLTAAGQFSGV